MKNTQIFLGAVCCWCLLNQPVHSAPFDVPEALWNSLTAKEKIQVSNALEVNLVSTVSMGVIMDVQTLDQSQAGTNAGSQLGAAFGSAAYVDKAFSGDNVDYSAKKHLGVALLAGVLGSAADKAPVSSFRTRYTIKLQEGSIQHIEEKTPNQFRHSVGMCVFLEPFRIANQQLCSMTKADLLAAAENKQSARQVPQLSQTKLEQAVPVAEETKSVRCKVGENSATLLPKSTCDALGGLID